MIEETGASTGGGAASRTRSAPARVPPISVANVCWHGVSWNAACVVHAVTMTRPGG